MKLTRYEKEYLRFNQHELIAMGLIFSVLGIATTVAYKNVFYGVATFVGGFSLVVIIKWAILLVAREHQKKMKLQKH